MAKAAHSGSKGFFESIESEWGFVTRGLLLLCRQRATNLRNMFRDLPPAEASDSSIAVAAFRRGPELRGAKLTKKFR
jgi:hypothetical protein